MNEHLLLGSPIIDRQHHALFASLRKLSVSGDSTFPEMVMSDALSELTAQIFEHFRTEEALMLELRVPDDQFLAHRTAHVSILEEVAQIHLDAMYGKNQALPEVIATVANWVQQHLIEFDLALKPYFSGSPNA